VRGEKEESVGGVCGERGRQGADSPRGVGRRDSLVEECLQVFR
jgi:hypothetical protein